MKAAGAERLVYQEGVKYIIGPNVDETLIHALAGSIQELIRPSHEGGLGRPTRQLQEEAPSPDEDATQGWSSFGARPASR